MKNSKGQLSVRLTKAYLRDKFGCRASEDWISVTIISVRKAVAVKRVRDGKLGFVQAGSLKQFSSLEDEAKFIAHERAGMLIAAAKISGVARETSGWQVHSESNDQILVDYGYYVEEGELHIRWRYEGKTGELHALNKEARAADDLHRQGY